MMWTRRQLSWRTIFSAYFILSSASLSLRHHTVSGQTLGHNLVQFAQRMQDLLYVLGPNYRAFCTIYWRYLILPCDILEKKFMEDMDNGQLKTFCNHIERCPTRYDSQSCMVQLTVTAVRLTCCNDTNIDQSMREKVTQTPEVPQIPPSITPDFQQFDIEAQKRCSFGRFTPTRRIVGGTAARRGEFPWIAMLLKDDNFICAGTILDTTHVVTAAHCFEEHKDNNYTIIAGKYITDVNEFETTQQKIEVSNFTMHEKYDRRFKWNDIAVVQLSSALNWTKYVMPACIPDIDDPMDRYCTVAGWGLVDVADSRPSEALMKTTLISYSKEECLNTFVDAVQSGLGPYLHEGAICAANGNLGGKDACKGDSGGPLMCVQSTENSTAFFVYGIVSNGFECATPGEPGVYTNLPYYINWLNDTITDMSSLAST